MRLHATGFGEMVWVSVTNRMRFTPAAPIDILRVSVYFKGSSGGILVHLRLRYCPILLLIAVSLSAQQNPNPTPAKPLFKLQEVMIPVRDGVHLETVILTPVDQQGPLPILFRRTPYGVPDKPPEQMPSFMKEL